MAESLWRGKFLEVLCQDTWEFVTRPNASCVVGIVAITKDQKIILVEQHRRPIGQSVIELPAGLVGDDPGSSHEDPLPAAKRELMEETGYASDAWTELMTGPSSPGLTDERVVMYLAMDAAQLESGGGIEGESIVVHCVPLPEIDRWLDDQTRRGLTIDFKVIAGLYFVRQRMGRMEPAR